jgi:hypothetical protein
MLGGTSVVGHIRSYLAMLPADTIKLDRSFVKMHPHPLSAGIQILALETAVTCFDTLLKTQHLNADWL